MSPWPVYKKWSCLWFEKLEQPKRRTTIYGLRTFSYLGSKLWNLLASEYSEVNDIDYERLKFLIKYWAGPNHDSTQGHFLWSTFCVLHACFRNHFFINLIAHTLRAGDCQFDSFVVAGGTVSCHYDKLRCHQWWRGCRVDDLLFSEYDIALYILALFICRILAFWLMLFVLNTTLNKFYLILSYLILSLIARFLGPARGGGGGGGGTGGGGGGAPGAGRTQVGPILAPRTFLSGIVNLRRSSDRLKFIMWIPILVRQHLYTETRSRLIAGKAGS